MSIMLKKGLVNLKVEPVENGFQITIQVREQDNEMYIDKRFVAKTAEEAIEIISQCIKGETV